MKTEYLKEFAYVAQFGSISGAARALFTTPSGITKHLSSLEKELGVQLVVRNTHSVSLTKEGSVFLETARHVLNELDSASLYIKSFSNGGINIAVHYINAYRKLFSAIKEYKNIRPDVPVFVFNSAFDNIISELDLMKADIVVGMNPKMTAGNDYECVEIDRIPICLVHDMEDEDFDIELLSGREILIPSSSVVPQMRGMLKKSALIKHSNASLKEISDLDTLLIQVETKRDCALIPANYVRFFSENIHVSSDPGFGALPLFAFYHKENANPYAAEFVDLLKLNTFKADK